MTTKEIFDDLGTFVSANLVSRNTKNGAKPYIEVLYNPKLSGGKVYKGEPYRRGAFQDSLKSSQNVLTSLREGDPITLKVVLNGKFRNLVGVETGHPETPHRSPSASRIAATTQAPKTDYNERAAKGQALNLAMTIAISEGRASDDSYILSLVPRMLALGEAVQNGNSQLSTTTTTTQFQGSSTSTQGGTNQVGTSAGSQESSVSTNGSTSSEVVDTIDSDINDLFGPL